MTCDFISIHWLLTYILSKFHGDADIPTSNSYFIMSNVVTHKFNFHEISLFLYHLLISTKASHAYLEDTIAIMILFFQCTQEPDITFFMLSCKLFGVHQTSSEFCTYEVTSRIFAKI